MSTPEEPARLVLESSGASAELRRALGAARGDLPSPDHVEALLAKFPFPDGGGGGDGGGGAPDVGAADVATTVAKGAGLSKWIASGVFLAASAGVAIYATRQEAPPLAPSATQVVVAASAPTTTAAATTAPEPTVTEPSASATTSASAPRVQPTASATAVASASASSGPQRSEIEILKEAHASRSDPTRMLALVNESARLYPQGVLAQEREMLRIEALLALGKRAEAKALADAFRNGNPNSVYAQRLNTLLPP